MEEKLKSTREALHEQDKLQQMFLATFKLLVDIKSSPTYKAFVASTPTDKGWLNKEDKLMGKVHKSCASMHEQLNSIVLRSVDDYMFYKHEVSLLWTNAYPLLEAKLGLALNTSRIVPLKFTFTIHDLDWNEEENTPPGMMYVVTVNKNSDKSVSKIVGLIVRLMEPSVIDPNIKCVFFTTSFVKQ